MNEHKIVHNNSIVAALTGENEENDADADDLMALDGQVLFNQTAPQYQPFRQNMYEVECETLTKELALAMQSVFFLPNKTIVLQFLDLTEPNHTEQFIQAAKQRGPGFLHTLTIKQYATDKPNQLARVWTVKGARIQGNPTPVAFTYNDHGVCVLQQVFTYSSVDVEFIKDSGDEQPVQE